jgi:PAS domain S-box-containing protein
MFKNLSTSTKLLILCGMFIIPIATTTYSLVAEKRIAVNFAGKELVGSRYLATVRNIYAAILFGETNDTALLPSKPDPHELLQALVAAQADAAGRLQTAELEQHLASTLRHLWLDPTANEDRNPTIFEALASARKLAARIGDDSNLALDTELDSYHMQTIVIGTMPTYVDRLCQLQTLLLADAGRGPFAGTHTAQILLLDGSLRSSAEQLKEDLEAAYRGNPDGTLKQALDAEMQAMSSSVALYLSKVSSKVFDEQLLASSVDRAYANAVDQVTRTWAAAQAELDRLLRARIKAMTNNLYRSLLLISGLSVLSIGVAVMTHRHIVRPLEQLESLARSVRETKDYSLRVDKTSRDEIGRLATAFNEMLAELASARAREVADHARSAEQALDLLVSVTGIASAASSVSALASDCLGQICISRQWQLAQVWYPDERDRVLRCADDPVYGEAKYQEFHKLSLATPMRMGQGLPGQAWANKTPVWISKVLDKGENLPRLRAAQAMGFKASFAFPVILGDRVLAVFEFLSEHTRAPDPAFLDAVEKLGRLLGDILVRKRSEAALRASEDRWRLVFENSSFGISLLDQDFRFVAANSAYQTMLGYTGEELRDLTPLDLSVEEERQTNLALFQELQEGKRQHYSLVKQLRRKDGVLIWVHVYAFVIPKTEFEPRIFFSTIIDVTESKRAQDALRTTQAELAHLTRLTTMGEMAASIAHEINQPLAAIVANAGSALRWLANKTPNLDEARAALKRIVGDGHRASDVIGSIRSMFREDRQQKVPLEVNKLIREVLTLLQDEIERHRVSVRTQLGDIPSVWADRVQFQQVILNLIMNALEAMSDLVDRPRTLHIQSELGETNHVLIKVEDNGNGIDPKNLDHVFDRFFTTKPQGMGMGLSICRSIVEAHQGQLWVERGLAQGSVFRIVLPTGSQATL